MSSFIGGSAFSMASQIAEGFILLTSATLRKFEAHEVRTLEAEMDKLAREIRGEIPPIDDVQAIQKKNRKLGRLNQAAILTRNYFQQRK